MRATTGIFIAGMCLFVANGAYAADAANGQVLFGQQCAGCHAIGVDAAHRFGPTLNGVFERPPASASGYSYSNAISKAVSQQNLVWDEESMDAFLKAPMAYLPGTKMAYPGLADEQGRSDVIAFLASIKSDGNTDGTIAEETESQRPVKLSESDTNKSPRPLARDTEVPTHGVLHLGRVALASEVAAWDIDIRPDGHGLPAGQGSALDGAEIYDAQCAFCHGVFGEGEGRWPVLSGGHDTLTDERPEKTIGSYWPYLSTVYDYVRRAMPFGNARSLSDDEVYELTAYLLYLNDLVDEDFVLRKENFNDIELPNVNNFIADDRSDEPSFKLKEDEPCMSDCTDGVVSVSQRARILDVTPDSEEPDVGSAIE